MKTDRDLSGALLESFVFAEVPKLMTASDLRLTPYHFRDQQMHEVDIVLERDDGMIVGIEVKASATVKSSDFAGLRTLAERANGTTVLTASENAPMDVRSASTRSLSRNVRSASDNASCHAHHP